MNHINFSNSMRGPVPGLAGWEITPVSIMTPPRIFVRDRVASVDLAENDIQPWETAWIDIGGEG
jgi:hypothetical protein